MNQAELYALAQKKMNNKCRICSVCNGIICAGEIPGFGGVDTGNTFYRNWAALQEYHIIENTADQPLSCDTRLKLFGQKLSMPIITAPIGSIAVNAMLKNDTPENLEDSYIHSLISGIEQAGVLAMIGDGPQSYSFAIGMKYANLFPGRVISIIKPRPDESIIERGHLTKRIGEPAFGVDVDSARLKLMKKNGLNIEQKSPDSLRKIAFSVPLPFIVKGVTTVQEASACIHAGAAAIVVSNHGGRILDNMPGTADVLPEIARVVKGRITILVDGGIRTGEDVFKMLALGADAVLIGRPVILGVIGAGANGVKILFDQWQFELSEAMRKAGASNLQHICRSMIQKVP
jgi:4-hydroxymandelate oxidase